MSPLIMLSLFFSVVAIVLFLRHKNAMGRDKQPRLDAMKDVEKMFRYVVWRDFPPPSDSLTIDALYRYVARILKERNLERLVLTPEQFSALLPSIEPFRRISKQDKEILPLFMYLYEAVVKTARTHEENEKKAMVEGEGLRFGIINGNILAVVAK